MLGIQLLGNVFDRVCSSVHSWTGQVKCLFIHIQVSRDVRVRSTKCLNFVPRPKCQTDYASELWCSHQEQAAQLPVCKQTQMTDGNSYQAAFWWNRQNVWYRKTQTEKNVRNKYPWHTHFAISKNNKWTKKTWNQPGWLQERKSSEDRSHPLREQHHKEKD